MRHVLISGLFSIALIMAAEAAPRPPGDTPPPAPAITHASTDPGPKADPGLALDELRRSLTLGGKPVPPLVFRDLGDGNAADTKSMLITVDVKAAIGSNQYGAPIKREHGFVTQTDGDSGSASAETESYRYLGATPDGLLVVVTRNNTADGSGVFYRLHVLEAAQSAAFDDDGKRYGRITLTTLQSRSIGDRWGGKATLDGNVVTLTKVDTGRGLSTEPQQFQVVRP